MVGCSQAFDLASGGLLPVLIPVYSTMFDRWYPDMFWRVWCPTMLRVVLCLCPVCSNTSDRRSTGMFWQV